MEKRKIPLYIDIKAGKQYLMDRDTNEIYVLSMDFKRITKRSGNLGFVFYIIGIPIIRFLSEPLRPHLYMDIGVYARITILAVTVVLCVLFGLFLEKTVKAFVKLRKTEKTTTPNPKLKKFIEEKLEIELNEYEPVNLDNKERRRLMKKSLLNNLFLSEPKSGRVYIERKSPGSSYSSPSVVVKFFFDGTEDRIRVPVSRDEYENLEINDILMLDIKPGLFGIRWIP
ncbi:MAG: hypothetical protein LBD23_03090 [Oscillospiraceae bacterium]|jgi:hypothetical protein|nr:hypothetical protein [Oscillospiraceae bacterium]